MASAAASLHTHKYSNVSNPSSEPSQEPIYQNQAELGLLKEPIYQNLPAHDKLIMQGPLSSSTCPTPLGADDKLLEDDSIYPLNKWRDAKCILNRDRQSQLDCFNLIRKRLETACAKFTTTRSAQGDAPFGQCRPCAPWQPVSAILQEIR